MSEAQVLVLAGGDPEGGADVVGAAREAYPGAAVAAGDGWAAVAVADGAGPIDPQALGARFAAARVVEVAAPYRLASREILEGDSVVRLLSEGAEAPGLEVGGSARVLVAANSPAALGSEGRLRSMAERARDAGATLLIAGELPWGEEGGAPTLDVLTRARRVADDLGLALCVEVTDHRQIAEASALADVLQVGWRNMQDFSLLRELGRAERPILLKRGLSATVEEFLLAAEYVLSHGNGRVILCESGIRTFDAAGKPRFEINAIPVIKGATHLPLLADPSWATPRPELVPAVARAAIAAGADGLVLDVADEGPEGDGIDFETLDALMRELEPIAAAVGRRF